MAKKKTTRKAAPKGGASSKTPKAKPRSAKPAKASKAGGRASPAASRHAPHSRRSSEARHSPKKGGGRKAGGRTPELFAQALDMAQSGFLFDAISAFKALAGDRKSDMADDAQCNIGLCYLRMHLYKDALEAFAKVISDFPDATIAQVAGSAHEFGHTAAKARLGRVHAYLGLGDAASARVEADSITDAESHVVAADGTKKTFRELADAAVRAAGA
jgi:TolA-binding protein